ncbi:MAG: hypothetical protein H6708_21785 [Kofleriaceae bacterium]|nr:hypothetical protein [Kofleriaceae bacterium]
MTDPADVRPSAGARLRLERAWVSDDGARARYRAAVLTPDAEFPYDLELAADAEPQVTATATAAPPELEAALTMLARLTARGVAKRVADGLAPWPPSLLRWRGPGRGA